MTEITIVSGWHEDFAMRVQGFYSPEHDKIGFIGGTERFCYDAFIRILIHEIHHSVLNDVFDVEICKKLDEIEDVDNMLYDELNLNLQD